MIPDINVLVAALRSDHVHHDVSSTWLTEQLQTDTALWLTASTCAGFVRIATHARIFDKPTPTEQALGFIDFLLGNPSVRWYEPSSANIWPQFSALCKKFKLKQNDIPDAWLAAQALALSCPLVTIDKGFKRYLPAEQLVLLGT